MGVLSFVHWNLCVFVWNTVMCSYELTNFTAAYKKADGIKIDGRRVVVDYERGRTQKNWLPRRLGGGKGDTRRNRESRATIEAREVENGFSNSRERGYDRDRERDHGGHRGGSSRGGDRRERDHDSRDRHREDRHRGGSERDSRNGGSHRDRSERSRGDRDRDRDHERSRDRHGGDRGSRHER
uniref:U1 small nuclear ribonucleoprotein 70 kDa n=1 Tax=Steinernema glaseri TaxID=37863 RepID=A0A1I7ZZ04_9BILA